MGDDDARVRLEGRAELLETTLPRYRLLLGLLRGLWWAQRLRKHGPLLHEVALLQDQVDEALERAHRHLEREAWPDTSPLRACLREVTALRAELEHATAKRLGEPAGPRSLKACLERLEQQVLTAPRVVLPGGAWATAHQVLPWPTPELQEVASFAQSLEQVFGRSLAPPNQLPFSLEELDAVSAAWSPGVQRLDAVWRRLAALDLTGVLVRELRARAHEVTRTPVRPIGGPEVLLHAEFWRSTTVARASAVFEARVGPVVCRDDERWPVLRWLWHLERGELASLPFSRGALIELAHAIATLPPKREQTEWGRLQALASRADEEKGDPDWQRLHDTLGVLSRVLAVSSDQGSTDSLAGLLRAMSMSGSA